MTSESVGPNGPLGQYVDVLRPLFDGGSYSKADQFLAFLCCLVRVGGVESKDSDPLGESTALLQDLTALSALSLEPETFRNPDRTRARLALISYCHLTEADFFYSLLANLLRVRAGGTFHFDPFFDLIRITKRGRIRPSPGKKIKRILELAGPAGFEGLAEVFQDVYLKDVRNAVFHADYTLTDTDFVMRHGLYLSPQGILTPAMPFDELERLLERSFGFYSAILSLHTWARRSFAAFRNKLVPFDNHYKGLLEVLVEGELVSGFRVYWPNGDQAEFNRTEAGCVAKNLTVGVDGGVELMVGLLASRPGTFSPLVEQNAEPVYSPGAGRSTSPLWPEDMRPFDAE